MLKNVCNYLDKDTKVKINDELKKEKETGSDKTKIKDIYRKYIIENQDFLL